MSASYRLGDYLLAMEGLAILRAWGIDPVAVSARAGEIAELGSKRDEPPYSTVAVIPEYEPDEGYRRWAAGYDGFNVLVQLEERAVHPLLAVLPRGRAIDAACGTGRHAAWLAEQGHSVIGVDASKDMLEVARRKLPAVDLRVGNLEALPLPDASADLAVCALALTHLPDIDRAIAELRRVLAPGGRLILSDVHPMSTALGLHAFFRTAGGERGCIRNRHHPVSAYLAAFREAGFTVTQCIEVPWDEAAVATMPMYPLIPDALAQACVGLPLVLVWEAMAP